MKEEQKQNYREHLISTIDSLIDGGVSIYDIIVVNKKAIRYNYVLKEKVIEEVDKILNSLIKGNISRISYWNGLIELKEKILEDK